jgi:hypothetical protein
VGESDAHTRSVDEKRSYKISCKYSFNRFGSSFAVKKRERTPEEQRRQTGRDGQREGGDEERQTKDKQY